MNCASQICSLSLLGLLLASSACTAPEDSENNCSSDKCDELATQYVYSIQLSEIYLVESGDTFSDGDITGVLSFDAPSENGLRNAYPILLPSIDYVEVVDKQVLELGDDANTIWAPAGKPLSFTIALDQVDLAPNGLDIRSDFHDEHLTLSVADEDVYYETVSLSTDEDDYLTFKVTRIAVEDLQASNLQKQATNELRALYHQIRFGGLGITYYGSFSDEVVQRKLVENQAIVYDARNEIISHGAASYCQETADLYNGFVFEAAGKTLTANDGLNEEVSALPDHLTFLIAAEDICVVN